MQLNRVLADDSLEKLHVQGVAGVAQQFTATPLLLPREPLLAILSCSTPTEPAADKANGGPRVVASLHKATPRLQRSGNSRLAPKGIALTSPPEK